MTARRRRGQPIAALGMVMLAWIGVRSLGWEGLPEPLRQAVERSVPMAGLPKPGAAMPREQASLSRSPIQRERDDSALSGLVPAPPATIPVSLPELPLPPALPASPAERAYSTVAAGHQIAWLAGLAQLPLAPIVRAASTAPIGVLPGEPRLSLPGKPGVRRWSADGWLLLRAGGNGTTSAGLAVPAYGASQAGAVVRYRLAPDSPHRPALFLRATRALAAPHDDQLAGGLSARPLAKVPLALLAEVRASRFAAGTRVRGAIGVVTEFDRIALPAGLSGEVYGQAGYVHGINATAFVDGQAKLDRRVTRIGGGDLRLGLGAWGGAQRGAARLDVGPAATLDFGLGAGSARIAADWRLRVAGDAAPRSGPALTLSAGF
jgi:hypothetical protein